MKLPPVFSFAALSLAFAGSIACAAEPAPTAHRLYTAVAMTGQQHNTSVPTDSGLYFREGANQWAHFGPRVLGVMTVAVDPRDPQVSLIASADGVVRSADGGRTWRKTTGWEVADVRAIVFDEQRPELAYAATAWGPLRSTDAGATWQLAQKGLPRLYGQTLVVEPQGRILLGTEKGLFASTDRAQSWHALTFPEVSVLRLAQSRADAKVLVAGTEGRGAWLSRDGAKTWTQISHVPATANVYAAAADPLDSQRLAVGGWSIGVRWSNDGGATWRDATAGLPAGNVFALAFDPDHAGRLWAGVFERGIYYSDDDGASWIADGLDGAYVFDFVFAAAPTK
ncbi:hypothetical protein K0B96_01165 [Horticoccus luteus]|uniref:Glycosyl hydrolase n=1 Tax=Horticoccus luteus TaxID=2862869 RepID=A0A8F9TWA8_9BACT|nr:glycoside hydrolase [Horticoccus luteus]QYM79257.1 hypothetical protein K0B96_01165 [Horticoccus luteus]